MSWLRKLMRAVYWMQRRKPNMIDNLPESLLLFKIFSKLRNPRDIIVCKSVSKKWNTLISSSLDHTPRSVLILHTHPQSVINDICVEHWKAFDLSNYIEPEFDSPVCVLASDKDILLCMKFSSSRLQFYIVNPVTMQWTLLSNMHGVMPLFPFGLLGNESMDKYYVATLVPALFGSGVGFRVIDTKSGLWRYVSIERQPWSKYGWCPTQLQALSFNRSLHWLSYDGPIVAFNSNHKDECIIIHRSQEMCRASYGNNALVSETLTVSKSHLRIIQLVGYPFPEDHHHLRIWTLVDYKQSIWKQEHDPLYFRDMISDHPWIQDYMQGYKLVTTKNHSLTFAMKTFMDLSNPNYNIQRIISPQPLHCDPNNPFVVYLYLLESIVSLDVTTKKLRLITRVSNRDQSRDYWKNFDKLIPITLQFDPTLVSDHI